jgi:hypothetical protein
MKFSPFVQYIVYLNEIYLYIFNVKNVLRITDIHFMIGSGFGLVFDMRLYNYNSVIYVLDFEQNTDSIKPFRILVSLF